MPATAKKKSDPHQTPAMRQFHRFKAEHPGCVLFFRMGDFYEMFYDDAELAHKVLGVTLTQRTKGIPMAGVPYHAVENYLHRMIQAGYRVAVCDQVEEASQAKGVVERDVTRVITPGTLTDESLLEEGRENPLAAVAFLEGDEAAVAWAELSTGAFSVMQCAASALADELARVGPSELLYCETADGEAPGRVKQLGDALGCPLAGRPAWQFRQGEAEEVLCRQYGVQRLAGFGFEGGDAALMPAGAVVQYLLETQRVGADGRLAHLRPPKRFAQETYLTIDRSSLASLEVEKTLRTGQVDGSLLGVMQSGGGCVTAMGKRELRRWLCYPLCDLQAIRDRQDAVATLVEDMRLREELREALSPVQDVARIAGRLSVGRLSPRDLVGLGQSAARVTPVRELVAGVPKLKGLADRLAQVEDALAGLGKQIAESCVEQAPQHLREGGLVRDGVDAELDEARLLQRDSHQWLAGYQKELLEGTNIPQLKVGYNKVFGYYIELTKANRDKAPEHWVRKQTLKNAERFITDELKQFESKVLTAQTRAVAREQWVFDGLCRAAAAELPALHAWAETVAELDVLGCFARQAVKHRYVRPEVVDEPVLQVQSGRHAVLDRLLGDRFVPNDVALDASGSLALITGPNMAGKSTYIRQTALITLLSHTGSFVPAESAVVGLTDRIFTRVGASDELHTGQSTFMVEMTETANICHHATGRSLVILDEIGRGTSTLDGLSLAWAIAEHLAARGCRTLFATHYHELTQLAERYEQVTNLHVQVREWQDEIVFLHRIMPGATDRSYGIHVAKIAGLPAAVVGRAGALLEQLEVNHSALETGGANKTASPTGGPGDGSAGPQMSLFTEYVSHPAVEKLRAAALDSMTPLQAFDLLRSLQAELSGSAEDSQEESA